jgi:folate-binding protein YgfZ
MSMKSDWWAFLNRFGALSESDGVLHFGAPEQEREAAISGDVLCDLSVHGLIRVTGADAETFLQGQFTNDVRQVTLEHSQLSAYCSPKGRMLACFRLFRHGDDYYLRLPQERVEVILKRLRMFVLRAKVTLADASADWLCLGLSGSGVAQRLTDYLSVIPTSVDAVIHNKGLTVIQAPGIKPRFELYGGLQDCQNLWTALAEQTTCAGSETWRLLDILAGVPNVYDATAEAFVPQMANLQLLHGISFQKGCYTGQEIVARTHYLGKLKRRMYAARVTGGTAPQPGDELVSAQQNAEVGKIVDACPHPQGGYALLAVLLDECAEGDAVSLKNTGEKLAFTPLPYAFADAAAQS